MKYSYITKAFTSVVIVDAVLCTVCMPYLGVYLSGILAQEFDLSLEYELVSTVLLSYLLTSTVLLFYSRRTRWQPQFSAQRFQCCLIQFRDWLNVVISFLTLVSIGTSFEKIIEDEAIKTPPVGEGAGYAVAKLVLGQFNVDIDILHFAQDFGLNFPQSIEPREIQLFEHGGEFMFWWAVLASCIAKLTYFNSVFTIIRASEIFIDLNPKFNTDENNAELQEDNVQEKSVKEPSVQEPSVQEPSFKEPSLKEPSVHEPSARKQSVQERNDEKDSELSIQFQQDPKSDGSVM